MKRSMRKQGKKKDVWEDFLVEARNNFKDKRNRMLGVKSIRDFESRGKM